METALDYGFSAPELWALASSPEAWVALLSLTALEIVLGLDNIVFIAVLAGRLPEEQRKLAYRVGLLGAMGTRIGLLFAITWVMGLTTTLFTVLGEAISGRDVILLLGGLFLIGKSTHEIYEAVELEGDDDDPHGARRTGVLSVIIQISVLDIVFSLDSVITAVGVADHLIIMIFAVVVAVMVMLVFARPIGEFVTRNRSMKVLALAFLLLIGVLLVAEGLDQHLNKGYIYFAMAFAFAVELLNLRLRRREESHS